jgi:hypothetical protein
MHPTLREQIELELQSIATYMGFDRTPSKGAHMSIAPIETKWNGYLFRSRLEARYGVLFFHMGIKFRYEPEGYHLGDGICYLPDFFLPFRPEHCGDHPGAGCFVEIKPISPSDEEREKARRLARATKHQVRVLFGDVWQQEMWMVTHTGFESTETNPGLILSTIGHLCGGLEELWGAVEKARSERFGT